jgi:Cysteine rich repeat
MRRALLLLPLVFVATAVSAAHDVQTACMADYLALCGSVPPGGGRVVACMKEHRAQVSMACKVAVLRHIAEKRGLISAQDNP